MPSHLSSIGLSINDQADFVALANRIGPSATPIKVNQGTYWRWTSDDGAEIWLQTNPDKQLIGMTPFFSGNGRIRVRLTARVERPDDTPLEGAFHGYANPDENDPESWAYPFVFDAVDYGSYAHINMPVILDAQIAAFAHEIMVYPTLDAYDKSQTEECKFASRSFIPSGLFSLEGESTEPPDSLAIFTGHVLASEIKTNSLTGKEYYWVLVDTLGGTFDVVVYPELCDAKPTIDGVISGSFWLCGQIIP